jgi:hypothetical protein
MANKSEKLVAFHGGLNNNSDAKDIAEDELSSAIDCSVSRVGRIGIIGGSDTALGNLSAAAINPVKDYGMFYFSSDRDKDGKQLSEDWLALYDSGDGKVQFYYRDKQGSTPAVSSIEDTFVDAGKKTTAKPSFFVADGILRYSNGDFTAATGNRVHQYIDKGFFEKPSVTAHLETKGDWSDASNIVTNLLSTTALVVGDTAEGEGIPKNTTVLEISGNQCMLSNVPTNSVAEDEGDIIFTNRAIVTRQGWVQSDQELKSFDDLGKTLVIDKSDAEGPDETALGDAIGKVILSYWTSKEGNWNGSFQFAASPIYHQGGIGPISKFATTINFHENKVSFQLHISRTDTSSESATVHPFGDDRIEGVRVFFRSHGSDKWHKLKDYDMLKGGKFNWDTYDGDTDKAYGIFDGSISDVVLANNTLTNYTKSCSYDDNSSTITHTADNKIVLGLSVTGTDIPTNTTITAINSPTSFSIAPKQTQDDATNATLTFNDLPARIKSFKATNATFTVTNSASGFDNRYGFLRLWGPYNEPIWKNVNDDGTPIALTSASHSISITTPADGKREFQVELLDETFNVVAQSTKVKITIQDSGNAPPPTYSDNQDSS